MVWRWLWVGLLAVVGCQSAPAPMPAPVATVGAPTSAPSVTAAPPTAAPATSVPTTAPVGVTVTATAAATAAGPVATGAARATVPAAGPIGVGPTPTVPLPTGAIRPEQFDEARAYAHVMALAGTIGKRVAGTEGTIKAAEYLRGQFESYGLQVEMQPFTFSAYDDVSTALTVVQPETRPVEAQALIFSPPGSITAALVVVPNEGRPEDYAALDVRGKIALVKRGGFFLRDKARNAAAAGAVAVVVYNSEPQSFVGTLQERVPIPTVAVSGDSGQALLGLLGRGPVTVRLESETTIADKQGVNVIGRRPGNERVLIFGGHYDAVQAGMGANDNASGTAVVLELARLLARSDRPETMLFIGFDAEELGLLGSKAYVERLGEVERQRVRAMLNFDMLGATDNTLVFIGSGELTELAAGTAAELGIAARQGTLSGGGSDHQSFADVGIRVLFFSREDPLFHTPQDTAERVRPGHLGAVGRIALRVLEKMQ